MGIFLLSLLAILVILYILLAPAFDRIELYCGEDWVIVWYNEYYIFKGRIKCRRNWKPLFSIEK